MTKPGTNSPAASSTTSAVARSAPPWPPSPAARPRPEAPPRPEARPPRQRRFHPPAATARPSRARPSRARRRPWSKSQEKLALLYNEQGRRPDEIAQKLGLSTYLVSQIILSSRNRGKL